MSSGSQEPSRVGDRERRRRAAGDALEPRRAAAVSAARSTQRRDQRRDQRRRQRGAPDLLGERRDRDSSSCRRRRPPPARASAVQPSSTICCQSASSHARRRHRALVGALMIARDQRAQTSRSPAFSSRKLARRVAQHLLVGAEAEVLRLRHALLSYFDFARPSTRSPRMLRWISLVPAAIVMPYEFR